MRGTRSYTRIGLMKTRGFLPKVIAVSLIGLSIGCSDMLTMPKSMQIPSSRFDVGPECAGFTETQCSQLKNAILSLSQSENPYCSVLGQSAWDRFIAGNYFNMDVAMDAVNTSAIGGQTVTLGTKFFSNGEIHSYDVISHEESHFVFGAPDIPEDGIPTASDWENMCASWRGY